MCLATTCFLFHGAKDLMGYDGNVCAFISQQQIHITLGKGIHQGGVWAYGRAFLDNLLADLHILMVYSY